VLSLLLLVHVVAASSLLQSPCKTGAKVPGADAGLLLPLLLFPASTSAPAASSASAATSADKPLSSELTLLLLHLPAAAVPEAEYCAAAGLITQAVLGEPGAAMLLLARDKLMPPDAVQPAGCTALRMAELLLVLQPIICAASDSSDCSATAG
jgi:hypothetical protein